VVRQRSFFRAGMAAKAKRGLKVRGFCFLIMVVGTGVLGAG
jgi:hypothetical protein